MLKHCGISQAQLREIFSGHITKWKEVGGPDKDIFVAVPDEDTDAYKNFVGQVMKLKEMTYFALSEESAALMTKKGMLPCVSGLSQKTK